MVAMEARLAEAQAKGLDCRIEGDFIVITLEEPITVANDTKTEARFKKPKFRHFKNTNMKLIQEGELSELDKLSRNFLSDWHEPFLDELTLTDVKNIVNAGLFFAGDFSTKKK